MSIRIVQLGTPRQRGEGVRLGTVRRPPRGVRKEQYAELNYFDVWLPNLAPSAELFSRAPESDEVAQWKRFFKSFESELAKPDASRMLDTLAALSHTADFSVGCYCEDESRCHRSVLRKVLKERGAKIVE